MKSFISIFIVLAMFFSVSSSILLANDEEDLEEYKEMMELLEKQNEQNLKIMESLSDSLIKPGGLLDKSESLLEFLKKTGNESDDKINLQVEKLDEKIIKTLELIEKNSLLKARINAMMINWRKLGVPQDQELKSHYESIRKELIESINVAKNK